MSKQSETAKPESKPYPNKQSETAKMDGPAQSAATPPQQPTVAACVPNLCINCHFMRSYGGHSMYRCQGAAVDVVTGGKLDKACYEMRMLGGECGPEGKLYKPAIRQGDECIPGPGCRHGRSSAGRSSAGRSSAGNSVAGLYL